MNLDPKMTYFPDPDEPEFIPFGLAFARMMFAHAQFEARIREVLLSVITALIKTGEVFGGLASTIYTTDTLMGRRVGMDGRSTPN